MDRAALVVLLRLMVGVAAGAGVLALGAAARADRRLRLPSRCYDPPEYDQL